MLLDVTSIVIGPADRPPSAAFPLVIVEFSTVMLVRARIPYAPALIVPLRNVTGPLKLMPLATPDEHVRLAPSIEIVPVPDPTHVEAALIDPPVIVRSVPFIPMPWPPDETIVTLLSATLPAPSETVSAPEVSALVVA